MAARETSTDARQVAVITGGSGGIGEAIARRLVGRGWLCVLLSRRRERLEALARELGAEFEVCDVAEREQVERAAATITDRHPAIKLLVNNAGIPGRRSFLELDPERIEHVLRVNYLGSVWTLRAFVPALERARPSDVVNIVSVAGTIAFPPSGPYSSSKHAQLAFSRATAAELRKRGIRVHTVNPGFVETEGFPQRTVLRNPFLRRAVIGPDRVAEHVLSALERDRVETYIPAWYRFPAILQLSPRGCWFACWDARRCDRWRKGRGDPEVASEGKGFGLVAPGSSCGPSSGENPAVFALILAEGTVQGDPRFGVSALAGSQRLPEAGRYREAR